MDPLAIIIVAVFCALIGAAIGSPKGQAGAGFFLGFLLGPIGIIVIAVMKDSKLNRIQAKPPHPGWWTDPLARFDSRYFDGNRWTQHVGRVNADGTRQQFEDPL